MIFTLKGKAIEVEIEMNDYAVDCFIGRANYLATGVELTEDECMEANVENAAEVEEYAIEKGARS